MKSPIMLWKKIAEDSAIRCHTSATMDIKTVQGRFKHEGLSFLTITLPSFGKDFQKSLDQGIVGHDMFRGFTRHAGLPRFLGGFLDRVFDRTSGTLLNEPCVDAVLAVRQLTLLHSKLFLPCSDAREKSSMRDYIECDREVKENDQLLDDSDYTEFHRVSRLLFSSVLTKVDKAIYDGKVIPKHGPGSTADQLMGNQKYQLREWTDRLETIFPAMDFLFPSPSHYLEGIDEVHYSEPRDEMPVKVISVPKTQKTPRIIAVEPSCMQYAQQAVLEPLVQHLETDNTVSSMIGFSDQIPNQEMARVGSLTGDLATLDLSDASDRVSNQLVRVLLSDHPYLQGAVEATRSRRARVPGEGIIRLAKFASMGSALCFPIEAMVFLTLAFMGIEKEHSVPLSRKFIKEFSGRVRVYGDDIVVPVDCVYSVIDYLEHFGARVGSSKSFWIGKFRESCGKEYYDGFDVSIVKVRQKPPSSRKDVTEVISLVSLRNQLYTAGYWGTVKWLDPQIESMIRHFPYVEESSSVLGRTSFLGYETQKMCEHLHAPLVKGYVVSPRLPRNSVDGVGALLKCFLKRGNLPVADRNHLERSGRPRSVDIKTRWARPF